jgi:predicted PhzF superfamily epimerase YddE/YHI9
VAVPISVVDAFTDEPFHGNPAAVCQLDRWPADEWLAAVASEMNLSETAFLVPRADGDHDLRWFTPKVEVDLCGHATLASAHVLGGTRRFHTRSGVLECGAADEGWITLDLPADPPHEAAPPEMLTAALRSAPMRWVGAGRFDWLVELDDSAAVRGLHPDHAAVEALGRRGLVVTARGDRQGVACVSRMFAPGAGIPEDPVTGSAHCMLAEHWGPRLGLDELVGEQASPRGGIVRMRRAGDRVVLAGRATTVWQGSLLIDP